MHFKSKEEVYAFLEEGTDDRNWARYKDEYDGYDDMPAKKYSYGFFYYALYTAASNRPVYVSEEIMRYCKEHPWMEVYVGEDNDEHKYGDYRKWGRTPEEEREYQRELDRQHAEEEKRMEKKRFDNYGKRY